jgi:Flp pilus assembly protein CpaB
VLRRWSRPSRWYLACGFLLALACILLTRSYLAAMARAAGGAGPAVPVLVAARDVPRGEAIRPEDLRLASIPRTYAPPGAFGSVQQAAGRVVLVDLARGEAVTRTRLARVRAGPVASLIPEGLRAFAVPSSLPPGSVVPGDLVDVLATFSSGQPHTETVVTGVQVLFVLGPSGLAGTGSGGSSGAGGTPSLPGGIGAGPAQDAGLAGGSVPGTLILLVAPEQEQRLAFVRAFADLSVAVQPAGTLEP